MSKRRQNANFSAAIIAGWEGEAILKINKGHWDLEIDKNISERLKTTANYHLTVKNGCLDALFCQSHWFQAAHEQKLSRTQLKLVHTECLLLTFTFRTNAGNLKKINTSLQVVKKIASQYNSNSLNSNLKV